MKLNLNFQIENLEGKEIGNAGKDLANIIASGKTKDPIKFMEWAKKMYKGEVIELDKSDAKLLREFVDECGFITLAKAAVLEKIDELK